MDLQSPSRQNNWFERHPKKTLFFIIALFFIALDLALAPYFAERIPNIKSPYYHHDLVANYSGEMNYGPYKYVIKTNSLGFKDNSNRSVSKVNNKYRLVFMGDSFTEGVGFAYDDTFVGMIAKQLGNSDYEVLNPSVSSYSPKLYYLKIKYLIENCGMKINEIFVFIDLSDVSDEIEYESFTPSNSELWTIFNRVNFFIKRNSFLGNLLIKELIKIRRDYLFRSFYREPADDNKNTINIEHNQENNSPAKPAKYWENMSEYVKDRVAWTHNDEVFNKWGWKGMSLAQENMDKLNELCKKNKIKLTISVYPWPEEIWNHNINSRNVTLWESFCKEKGINFINCYPYFFTGADPEVIVKRYFIANESHFNLEGHKLMAKIWLDHYNLNNFGKAR